MISRKRHPKSVRSAAWRGECFRPVGRGHPFRGGRCRTLKRSPQLSLTAAWPVLRRRQLVSEKTYQGDGKERGRRAGLFWILITSLPLLPRVDTWNVALEAAEKFLSPHATDEDEEIFREFYKETRSMKVYWCWDKVPRRDLIDRESNQMSPHSYQTTLMIIRQSVF